MIIGKILTGLLSFSTMLFSTFQGNTASFSTVSISSNMEAIVINTHLVNAFDNEFEHIFNSGKEIVICLELLVRRDRNRVERFVVYNTASYDPVTKYYLIEQGSPEKRLITANYQEMLRMLSEVELLFDYELRAGTYQFELKAHLEPVVLETFEKEFDMMVLWNYKIPKVTFSYEVELDEI